MGIDIEERQIAARNSSNLKVDGVTCDAAILIAAAKTGHPEGEVFNDLKREFDEAHAAIRRDIATRRDRGEDVPDLTRSNLRLMAAMRMPSLNRAKELALEMAHGIAFRADSQVPVGELPEVAWQAISLWLDEKCERCGGTGQVGEYGKPRIDCHVCRDQRKRRQRIGRSAEQRLLIVSLSMAIDEEKGRFLGALARTARQMRDA